MHSPVRIVIVEDEILIRSMLRLFCESEDAWYVVGEAGDCASACSVVEAMCPDIVILDLSLGGENGLDCLPHLLRLGARRVVVFTGNEDPATHALALKIGAARVLRKGDSSETILGALREQAVEIALEKRRGAAAAANVTRGATDSSGAGAGVLSPRERQILELLTAGRKDGDIARELDISESTLHHLLTDLYRKLGVSDRVALVVYAFQHHLATAA